MVLIKCCSDFPKKKLVNPKFTDQIRLCKVKTPWVKKFNPGLVLFGFCTTGPRSQVCFDCSAVKSSVSHITSKVESYVCQIVSEMRQGLLVNLIFWFVLRLLLKE